MAKRKNQSHHDSMVKAIADHLKQKGHSNVKADIQGYEKPDLIYWDKSMKGHIPDVTSKQNQSYIFEVETEDSIDDTHTADQWTLFAANAKQYSKAFIVVVPKGYEQQARRRAQSLNIQLTDVWGL